MPKPRDAMKTHKHPVVETVQRIWCDAGIRPFVDLLNLVPDVHTIMSCQGGVQDTGTDVGWPIKPYVTCLSVFDREGHIRTTLEAFMPPEAFTIASRKHDDLFQWTVTFAPEHVIEAAELINAELPDFVAQRIELEHIMEMSCPAMWLTVPEEQP